MATPYGDKDGFTAYASENGYVLPDGISDADINAALLRGSRYIDTYEPRFPGYRTGGYAQERAWPRTCAVLYSGEVIPDAVIPDPIVSASYEAAFLEATTPGILSPVITGSSAIKREKVDSLEVEYAVASSATQAELMAAAKPCVTVIEGLLWPFLYVPYPFIAAV